MISMCRWNCFFCFFFMNSLPTVIQMDVPLLVYSAQNWDSPVSVPYCATIKFKAKQIRFFFTLVFVSTSKQVLEAFFRRALAWEKRAGGEEQEEGLHAISLSEERDGVYFYKSGHEIGVMLEGNPANFPSQKIRSIVPGLKGFALVIIQLDKVS